MLPAEVEVTHFYGIIQITDYDLMHVQYILL